MKFNPKALWALVAFILVVVVAAGQTALSIGAVVAAGVALEIVTWRGAFGLRERTGPKR